MNDELPFGGNAPGSGNDVPYAWLDEWLCEYVDGTMDPSLETVFEQYVQANPELKAHVNRLRETRELLCNCGLSGDEAQERGPKTCREESLEGPLSARGSSSGTRPPVVLSTVGLVSSIAVALLVGFLAGATLAGWGSSSSPRTPSKAAAPVVPGPETRIERTTSQVPSERIIFGGSPFAPLERDSASQQRTVSSIRFP